MKSLGERKKKNETLIDFRVKSRKFERIQIKYASQVVNGTCICLESEAKFCFNSEAKLCLKSEVFSIGLFFPERLFTHAVEKNRHTHTRRKN